MALSSFNPGTAGLLSPAQVHDLLIRSVVDYAIYMLDAGGCVVSWNAGAMRIKGYDAEEILGRHFSCFYTEADQQAGVPAQALRIAAETGRFAAEAWRRRKDGTHFWASVVIDAIREDGILIGFAKVTRDLTERRQAELEIEESREQLLQLQKMEAIGHLTGGLAHDFNNLLTGIAGSLELMRMRIAQGRTGDLERYVVAAQGAASRAAALTHRLLAFARRQTLDPKVIDLNSLVGGMEELIRRSVGPEVTLDVVLSPTTGRTYCDANQLENAILNLAINARDAMPKGGRLTIRTDWRALDEAAARLEGTPPGPYVALVVTDEGTGMTPEVLAQAFDPFFTTKPLGEGTGLGLSMIYGFARQSGGAVRIRSEPGQGAEVTLLLPRDERDAEALDAAPQLKDVPRALEGEIVLVVDDEPAVRVLVTEMLKELGYRAIEAADGASGLAALEGDGRVDLVISDIGLPGPLTGRHMIDIARTQRPGLKVLFITGYAEQAALQAVTFGPRTQVLTKPFALEMLANKIRSMISEPPA